MQNVDDSHPLRQASAVAPGTEEKKEPEPEPEKMVALVALNGGSHRGEVKLPAAALKGSPVVWKRYVDSGAPDTVHIKTRPCLLGMIAGVLDGHRPIVSCDAGLTDEDRKMAVYYFNRLQLLARKDWKLSRSGNSVHLEV